MKVVEWFKAQHAGVQVALALALAGAVLVAAVVGSAIVGAFVLGVGESQEMVPQGTYEWSHSAEDETAQVTHKGGDEIDASNLVVRVDGEERPLPTDADVFTQGDSVVIENVPEGSEVTLLWQNPDSDEEMVITVFTP
jgi:hypothetical protein